MRRRGPQEDTSDVVIDGRSRYLEGEMDIGRIRPRCSSHQVALRDLYRADQPGADPQLRRLRVRRGRKEHRPGSHAALARVGRGFRREVREGPARRRLRVTDAIPIWAIACLLWVLLVAEERGTRRRCRGHRRGGLNGISAVPRLPDGPLRHLPHPRLPAALLRFAVMGNFGGLPVRRDPGPDPEEPGQLPHRHRDLHRGGLPSRRDRGSYCLRDRDHLHHVLGLSELIATCWARSGARRRQRRRWSKL